MGLKGTGIVRRIDDLGRIVIPKEIRRAFKLKEGDPMELFVTPDGVLFKKYSVLGSLQEHASECAAALHRSTSRAVYITDTERTICVYGIPKKDNINKENDPAVTECIEEKKEKFIKEYDPETLCFSRIIVPVIADGDCVGTVVVTCKEQGETMGELELKLAQNTAYVLNHMLERYS